MLKKGIRDIDALAITNFSKLPDDMRKNVYESKKQSFIKTAEFMKALDEGETWEQIGVRLMEGHKYCQYPIGEIAHMMLAYSKFGIEFVQRALGDSIDFLFPSLKKELDDEMEKENQNRLSYFLK